MTDGMIGFGTTFDSVADVLSIDASGITIGSVDVSNMSSTDWKEFVQGALADGGDFTVKLHYTKAGMNTVMSAIKTSGSHTIEFPDGGTFAFSGFPTKLQPPSVTMEGALEMSVTYKVSGELEFTAGT